MSTVPPSSISSAESGVRTVSPFDAISAILAARKKVNIDGIDRTSMVMSMDAIYRAQGAVRADLITNLQKQLQTIKGYEKIAVVDNAVMDIGD